MGRGRAKAKQTKVARDLKYRSVDMDLTALERELRAQSDEAEIPDQYADLAEEYDSYTEYDIDDDDEDEAADDDPIAVR